MDEQQTPTSTDTQPAVAATPPGATADHAEGAPTTDASLQRAYTQVSQKNAAIAAALGIPKTSTTEQFVSAINARRASLASADSELEANPELARRAAELQAREERLVRQQYGDTADLALTLRDAARGQASLVDLVAIVDEALADRSASRSSAAPTAPAAAPQAPAPTAPPVERNLMVEPPRGNAGMFDPGITPDREAGPEGFFRNLVQKVRPGLL